MRIQLQPRIYNVTSAFLCAIREMTVSIGRGTMNDSTCSFRSGQSAEGTRIALDMRSERNSENHSNEAVRQPLKIADLPFRASFFAKRLALSLGLVAALGVPTSSHAASATMTNPGVIQSQHEPTALWRQPRATARHKVLLEASIYVVYLDQGKFMVRTSVRRSSVDSTVAQQLWCLKSDWYLTC
jgi:hypothetical protein